MDFEKGGDGMNPGAPGRWDTGYPWGPCGTAAWIAWPRSKQEHRDLGFQRGHAVGKEP